MAAASVLVGKVLIAIGLRRPHEGWRRTVGILLRSESTRFALSAFGLRVPQPTETSGGRPVSLEARTAEALHFFLARESDAHFGLAWEEPVTLRYRIPSVDLVVLQFADDGRLESLIPYLAASPPAPALEVQGRVHDAILRAYNRTVRLPEVARTRKLLGEVLASLGSSGSDASSEPRAYAQRLLGASCLSFEGVDLSAPEQRFHPPAFWARRPLGFGYLSWMARTNASRGTVDLWGSAHHVGLDGVPLQDLLNRLEQAWGMAEALAYPDPTAGAAFAGPVPCHAPGEREVDQLLTFVDFSPVLALRRQLSTQLGAVIGGDVTFGALLGWLLSRDPEFHGVRIASTVDVAASSGYERDVDVVSLRAADFIKGDGPWEGFAEYAREFNRLIAAARARTSPVRAGMQTAGLIPPWAHATVVRGNPAALDDAFGTLCVTIIRDARVFIAPMTDLGLGRGFFAIGSAGLPSVSGARVTAVSIKGDAGRVGHYPAILQRVIDRAAALTSTGLTPR